MKYINLPRTGGIKKTMAISFIKCCPLLAYENF